MGTSLITHEKRSAWHYCMVKAKAMILADPNVKTADVTSLCHVSKGTVAKIRAGYYDEDFKAGELEAMGKHLQGLEDGKLTKIIGAALDVLLDNPEKLEEATGPQLAMIVDTSVKNRELMAGRATERREFSGLNPDELKAAIRDAQREVVEAWKAGAIDGETVPEGFPAINRPERAP